MLLDRGEKLHVIQRRLFESDTRRHFVGEVAAVDGPAARVEGYAFVFDAVRGGFERKPEHRVRLVSLSDARLIITVLPRETDIESCRYAQEGNRLVLTDGKQLKLDVNEFGARR